MIPIYSISKPFLAQAIIELGFPLSTPIGKFLPSLSEVYRIRTLAQLLNHTSGLSSYGELPAYQKSVDAQLPAWERDKLLADCESLPHSNHGFTYSNLGYLLLRMLLEQELQLSYFNAIKELVLDPLGIDCFLEWETSTSVVPNYDPKWVYSGTFLGEREHIASAVGRLAKHRSNSSSLSSGLIPVDIEDSGFDSPGYNFGFMTDGGSASDSPKLVGHGGSGPGYELMVLVETRNWNSAIEVATDGLTQSEAILRLRQKLQLTDATSNF
ncbi:MAG: serine hydrolase [Actinomycetales bacterium]|nr:serine hydrolase [Actinomycetales bacterium]